MSEICNRFEPLPQVLKNVRYKNGGQPLDNVGVQRAISAGKSKLGKSGRLVIRPSGTEPVIRVMAEGDDVKLVDTVVCVKRDVEVHPTSELTGDLVHHIYGGDVKLVHHDHRCAREGHTCSHS